uniref:Uncharacterized protein n=1 Tax=Panagrolaimus sp. ES5 TaxID=591445 RepID=A0AC34F4Q5_9BILA
MFCPGITVLGKNVIRKTNTNEFIKDEQADALKNLASSAREIGLKIKNAKPKRKSSFDVQDPLLSYLASKYANNRNSLDNSAIDGKQHTKWTTISRDIMAEPSYRVVSDSRYPYDDDATIAGKLKWDIYNPKKSTQKQHIFSNIPYDFSDDNVVVTKIQ